jgi:hypothetical protein
MAEYMQRIAKIESTQLGYEDHGILTAYLQVSYGGGLHQGVGGYGFDEYVGERGKGKRIGTAYGMEFVARLLRACGVERWEQLPGRTVYVLTDESQPMGFGGKAVGIEPLPTEPGERFMFEDLRQQFYPEASV